MKTTVYNKLTHELLSDWKRLWNHSRTATINNSPVWFDACLKAFGYSGYRLFATYQDRRLLAILPLVYDQKYFVPALCCPGGSYTDKCSLLLNDSNQTIILSSLLTAVERFGNIYLAELNADDADQVSTIKGWKSYVQPWSINRFIPLEKNSFRFISDKNIKRFESILKNNIQHLAYSHITNPTIADLNKVINLEKVSNRGQKRTLHFDGLSAIALYSTLIEYYPNSIHIIMLTYDKQPIAADIGFVYHTTFSGVYTVYDRQYKRLGPGKLCKYLLLQSLSQQGFTTLDMSRGDESYKREMTPLAIQHADAYYANNPLILWWWHSLNKLKVFIETQPKLYEMAKITKDSITKTVRYLTCL